jgi:fructokinase
MRIGIDLGGTKIEAVAMDSLGEVRARERVVTPKDYAKILGAIRGLVQRIEGRFGPIPAVGIGTPGAISPATGLMKNAENTAIQGKPFDQDLCKLLEREVRIANDANCFTLSEAVDGAGSGATAVFGVIVGTGTGGGLVVDGKICGGANAICGEWGHNQLPWMTPEEFPGPECYCGKTGCIESYLSGPGLARDHEEATGEPLPGVAISELASSGDEQCKATLERYCDRMARSLASVINVFDPDVIVLGGGVSQIPEIYKGVPARWGRYVFSDRVDTRLLPNRFGDSSGVRGAAWLWPAK